MTKHNKNECCTEGYKWDGWDGMEISGWGYNAKNKMLKKINNALIPRKHKELVEENMEVNICQVTKFNRSNNFKYETEKNHWYQRKHRGKYI